MKTWNFTLFEKLLPLQPYLKFKASFSGNRGRLSPATYSGLVYKISLIETSKNTKLSS